jgi:predicted transcriptional regulator with HTH domain
MIKITSSHRSESDTSWRALDIVEFKTLSVRYKDMGQVFLAGLVWCNMKTGLKCFALAADNVNELHVVATPHRCPKKLAPVFTLSV